MTEFFNELQTVIDKKSIFIDEPMSKHTSFKIGGKADYFIKVYSISELKEILKLINKYKINFFVIGNGTNLLVKDNGFRGVVIKLELKNFKIKNNSEEVLITAETGMTLAMLSAIAVKEELTGLEFLSGIPGTIGGAIRMNAGAYGSEMKDIVVKSRYITYDGKIKTMNLKEHKFEYRNSVFSQKEAIILDTTVAVKKGKKSEIENKIKEYAESRKKSQPLEYPNAGSTFKRCGGDVPTAKLIDDCGLKGYSVGDAEISTKHAGFVINKGKAKAKDVLTLTDYIKNKVKEKYDKDIELEILILGE